MNQINLFSKRDVEHSWTIRYTPSIGGGLEGKAEAARDSGGLLDPKTTFSYQHTPALIGPVWQRKWMRMTCQVDIS